MTKGKFITIEGIDGSGKGTTIKFLKKHPLLENTVFTYEPRVSGYRTEIEEAIKNNTNPMTVLFLFMADRAQHLHEVIIPAINNGKNVISDRYFDSTIVYQSTFIANYLNEQIQPGDWIKMLHKNWAIVPDASIFIDVDPEIALHRIDNNRDQKHPYEKIDQLKTFREHYNDIISKEPNRWYPITNNTSIDNMFTQVDTTIKHILKK
jgi:dTMP kinase